MIRISSFNRLMRHLRLLPIVQHFAAPELQSLFQTSTVSDLDLCKRIPPLGQTCRILARTIVTNTVQINHAGTSGYLPSHTCVSR